MTWILKFAGTSLLLLLLTGCSRDEAILYSAAKGHSTLVRVLLSIGADPNATATVKENERLFTPLILASTAGDIATVRLLIEHDAKVNEADVMGFTALHAAAMDGHSEIVSLLIKNGANPKLIAAGDTPASLAERNGHNQIAAMLNKASRNGNQTLNATQTNAQSNISENTSRVSAANTSKLVLPKNPDLGQLLVVGSAVYGEHCMSCHQTDGKGTSGFAPALAGSQIVQNHKDALINVIVKGRGAMPSFSSLTDVEIAGAIAYVRNAWGNSNLNQIVMPHDVLAVRR